MPPTPPSDNLPKFLNDLMNPNPRPFDREMRQLRRSIRQTHRKIQDGTLDYHSGTLLLSRLANSLAQLHLAEHRMTPHGESAQVKSLQDLCMRLLTALGFGPLPAEEP